MTTPQIDYSKPVLLPTANGGVFKLQLNSKIHGHSALMAAIALAVSNQPALEGNNFHDIKKFDAMTDGKIDVRKLTDHDTFVGL